jgi:hypothetical protein
MKVTVDTRELTKFAKALKDLPAKALPHAARNTLNGAAFAARAEFNQRLGKNLTLRNTFTTRGTIVEKARGTNVNTMQAVLGNTRSYVGEREGNATNVKRGKHGVAVPTPAAAGQGGTGKRTKTIRRKNFLSALSIARRVSGSPKRRNAAALRMAAKGTGVAYLDLGRRKGLFRVTGSAKRGMRITMLYDLSKPTTEVKARPSMQQAIEAVSAQLPAIALKAFEDQLRWHLARSR